MKKYFSNYGYVLQTVVMRDKISSRPKGFGFVVFVDLAVLDKVLQDTHTIDGRTVNRELKRIVEKLKENDDEANNNEPERTVVKRNLKPSRKRKKFGS